jgi:hypothetical protein
MLNSGQRESARILPFPVRKTRPPGVLRQAERGGDADRTARPDILWGNAFGHEAALREADPSRR